MKIQKLGFIALSLALCNVSVRANDVPAAPVAPDGAVAAQEELGAKRAPRVKIRKRSAAAAAVAAAQTASVVPADEHASHDTPGAAAADAHAGHDAPVAPATVDAAAAVPDGHAAPPLPESAKAAATAEECNPPLKSEIGALFDRWNASLRTGDPKKVVANYAPDSVLLPTVSNRARFTAAEKEDYFTHFLQRRPQGYIDDRMIDVDCNSATDAGLYTFRFADGSSVKARYSFSYRKIDGQWLITSHHSSGMPEKPQAPVAHAAESAPVPKSAESVGQAKGWVRFP